MIKAKITKNIIRKGISLMGVSVTISQIVVSIIGIAIGAVEILLMKDNVDVNIMMTVVFITLAIVLSMGVIRLQGMSFFKLLLKSFQGTDKRPYCIRAFEPEYKGDVTMTVKRKKSLPFSFGKKMVISKTAQDAIPFLEAYDNSLFLTAPETYTLVFAFSNLDYTLFRESEQEGTYQQYQRLMNALPTDIGYQEFIMNTRVNSEKLKRTLIPQSGNAKSYGEVFNEYVRMMEGFSAKNENAAADKLMLIALSYKPNGVIDNANVLFKYYRELQKYFATLGCDVKQLEPQQVFATLHEFYHPFDGLEFLLPKDIYAKGSRIKDYIAPSMLAFRSKEIEVGETFTRVLFVNRYDRECDDSFIRDILDNNQRITLSKHLHRLDKSEALEKVNKQILDAQGRVQKRMETNHKSGTNFIPFRYLDRLKELENLQERLSGTGCELFEVGVYIALSARTAEELEELTLAVKTKAMKHQVKLDILRWQQEKGMDTVLPMGINHFSDSAGNNVNTYMLTDAACILIPFSTCGYYAENGIFYGINQLTDSTIVLDRTEEMNSNGFTLGFTGSGKSMFTKAEIIDVVMKYPNDEIIIVDPENEYAPLVKELNGETFRLSPNSDTKINIFDTDLSYVDEGQNAISMKSDFIMSVVETAKGAPLSAAEKSIIDRCVKNIYKPFIESHGDKDYLPDFNDFYDEICKLDTEEAHDIALTIELYVKGSFNSFSGFTNIDVKKKFLVIDIMEMGEQLRGVGLQVILEFLWQRVIANKLKGVRTWVWIDEFSFVFSSERSADFFAKVYKRIRKHGGVITGITQNITEVIESKQARTMLQNTQFVVLLQQNSEDLDVLINIFKLSESQSDFIKNGKKGSGLIICGKKIIPFEKIIPSDNLIYKICTTKFKDNQAAESSEK